MAQVSLDDLSRLSTCLREARSKTSHKGFSVSELESLVTTVTTSYKLNSNPKSVAVQTQIIADLSLWVSLSPTLACDQHFFICAQHRKLPSPDQALLIQHAMNYRECVSSSLRSLISTPPTSSKISQALSASALISFDTILLPGPSYLASFYSSLFHDTILPFYDNLTAPQLYEHETNLNSIVSHLHDNTNSQLNSTLDTKKSASDLDSIFLDISHGSIISRVFVASPDLVPHVYSDPFLTRIFTPLSLRSSLLPFFISLIEETRTSLDTFLLASSLSNYDAARILLSEKALNCLKQTLILSLDKSKSDYNLLSVSQNMNKTKPKIPKTPSSASYIAPGLFSFIAALGAMTVYFE